MTADQDLELEDLEASNPDSVHDEDDAAGSVSTENELPDIGDLPRGAKDLEAVYDIPVQVSAVLGKSTMQVSHLLKLGRGAVVELDRKVGEAIDIYVNNRLVARGEVVVVEDHLGVTMICDKKAAREMHRAR